MLPLTILLQIDDPHKLNGYLILGYVVMWAIAMAYLLYLANRQRNLREDISVLRDLLQEEEGKTSDRL